MTARRGALLLLAGALAGSPVTAQDDSLTTAGVYRASAAVDSVFIDRIIPHSQVTGGDFGSYLLARLQVMPIPADLRLRVAVDTHRIVLRGTIADLPLEARRELGPVLTMFPPQTPIQGFIELRKVAREVVGFRLAAITVSGVPIPESVLGPALAEVGRRYPVLSRTGRDLFVEIPRDAEVRLVPGAVRLIGPPAEAARPAPGGSRRP